MIQPWGREGGRRFLQEAGLKDLRWEPGEGTLSGMGWVVEERVISLWGEGKRMWEKRAIPSECSLHASGLH